MTPSAMTPQTVTPAMPSLPDDWYRGAAWLQLLRPLSALYLWLSRRRRTRLSAQQQPGRLPVIVVGNITVGGTGKTPVVIALAQWLESRGYRVAILSRGYGAAPPSLPFLVTADCQPEQCGDEIAMMRPHLNGIIMIDPDRRRAMSALDERDDCDIVISDDGLQHYRLRRDIEWVIIDGARGLGNGYCLPAGPLREPVQRLHEVDEILVNGLWHARRSSAESGLDGVAEKTQTFALQPSHWVNVKTGEVLAVESGIKRFQAESMHAIAGIGNPQRFFQTLKAMQLTFSTQAFADHHPFQAADLADWQHQGVLMTEKDAIKCQSFAGDNWWYLQVSAVLPETVLNKLLNQIESLNGKKAKSAE